MITKNIKKSLVLLLAVLIAVSVFAGCGARKAQEDIIILYTNDVHCAIDGDIGYDGLAAYKALCGTRTPYVALVDCGDAVQGDIIGAVSDGEYIVDIMNRVGYDYAVPGNHEFDYGTEQLSTLIEASDATYLACNMTYSGNGGSLMSVIKPYSIAEYGGVSVAYIGVATPESITKSTPSHFKENGEFVYGFCGESGEALYSRVQSCIDECLAAGADYIVILSHLGDAEGSSPFTSTELIRATTGVDAVLDAHAHSEIPCRVMTGASGEQVLLSSAGTKLNNIGQLIITANGTLSVGLISGYDGKDAATGEYIGQIKSTYEDALKTVVATSDTLLSVSAADGARLVRNRETAIGNLCADAYRAVSGAEIAFVNGGGIRADIPAGDITYADIIAVHPYGNMLCTVKATGSEILDCLEAASRYTEAQASKNGSAVGECGGFIQVSGLKYTIDTSVESTVVLDDKGMFASVGGARRVTDVEVMGADGAYLPIDPERIYTLASHNYLIKDGGDGLNMFADNELVIDCGMSDYQMLITYMTDNLGGNTGELYGRTDGRITVR